ncbi:MAG: hypothetical protein Q9192_007483, partial [Flavoplaca navasiana]
MTDLAELIRTNTEIVNRYFLDRNIAPPSLEVSSPSRIIIDDERAAKARFTVLAAMHKLRCLILGLSEAMMAIG